MSFWTLTYVIIISTCCFCHQWLDDDNDLHEEHLILGKKPQVAELKNYQSLFETSNDSKVEAKQKTKLIVSTILQPPFVMFKKDSYQIAGNDRFEGFMVDLFRNFAQSLSFDYEIRLASDSKYGSIYEDKFWDGVIGKIHRKEAHIAIGPLVVTKTLQKFVDFTQPLLTLRYSALISKPSSAVRKEIGEDEELIKDVSQLLSSGMPCGVVRDGQVHQMLENSSLPVHRAILSKVAENWPKNFVESLQEGVTRARSENYAFIVDTPIAEYEAGKQPCDLYTTEPFLDLVEYALALNKEVVYETENGERSLKEVLDEEIVNLKRGDDMQALYLHWWKDECSARKRKQEADDDESYHVIEWTLHEQKGQKSFKVKNEGHSPHLTKSSHADSTQNEANYYQLNSKSRHQNRSDNRRYHSSSNSSNLCPILLVYFLVHMKQ